MRIVVLGAGISGLVAGLLLARDGHDVTLLERDGAAVPEGPTRRGRTGRATAWRSFARRTTCSRAGARSSRRSCPTTSRRWAPRGRCRFDVLSIMPPTITDRSPRPGDERFVTLTARRPVLEQVLARAAERAGGPGRAARRGRPRADDATPTTACRTSRGVVDRRRRASWTADLVVDAMGRRSPMAGWIAEHRGRAGPRGVRGLRLSVLHAVLSLARRRPAAVPLGAADAGRLVHDPRPAQRERHVVRDALRRHAATGR